MRFARLGAFRSPTGGHTGPPLRLARRPLSLRDTRALLYLGTPMLRIWRAVVAQGRRVLKSLDFMKIAKT